MGFWRKLCCWKRRRNDATTTRDIATTTDNLTSESGTQVSSVEIILKCDAGTQVESNMTCEASTQTLNVKEPINRTDGHSAEKGNEEMESKIAALEMIIQNKDSKIRKLNDTILEMKVQQRNEIQYIQTKEQIEKSSLLRKIRSLRQEIIHLKESRPPPTEKETADHPENKSKDQTDSREARGSCSRQQSATHHHCPNLPHRQQNRNLPPRLQKRK